MKIKATIGTAVWRQWVRLTSVFLMVSTVVAADKRGLSISGIYEYSLHPDAPKPLFSTRCCFEITRSDCFWTITYEEIPLSTNIEKLNADSVASFDGKSIYFVQFQNQDIVKKRWGEHFDSVKSQLTDATAEIFLGNYPPPKQFILQNIWFGMASKCVLDACNGKVKPPFLADLAVFDDTIDFCIIK